MSRKTSATPSNYQKNKTSQWANCLLLIFICLLDFSLDPDILRELNARYLHDINVTRTPSMGTNTNLDGNNLPAFLLPPPFLRAEHYHQHTHTHEHNLNILTPSTNSLLNGNTLVCRMSFISSRNNYS